MADLINIITSNTSKPVLVTGFVNSIQTTNFSYDYVNHMSAENSANKIHISLCEYVSNLTNVYFLDIKQLILAIVTHTIIKCGNMQKILIK